MSERLPSKAVVVVRIESTYVCIRLAFPRRIPVKVLGFSVAEIALLYRLFLPRLISSILFRELAMHRLGGN
jgi:hypothetical protein